ncbi:MAG: hypothetical protein LBT38_06620 [Deltaproteobacteria bacterium]|jgi:hypothetical protein|nr:hypothetical protein [Deltaproteobacteria bacterium]
MATINIKKTIEIPDDRRLKLDLELPDSLPPGKAELSLTVTPLRENSGRDPFEGFYGCIKSGAYAGDPVEIQRKLRDE